MAVAYGQYQTRTKPKKKVTYKPKSDATTKYYERALRQGRTPQGRAELQGTYGRDLYKEGLAAANQMYTNYPGWDYQKRAEKFMRVANAATSQRNQPIRTQQASYQGSTGGYPGGYPGGSSGGWRGGGGEGQTSLPRWLVDMINWRI